MQACQMRNLSLSLSASLVPALIRAVQQLLLHQDLRPNRVHWQRRMAAACAGSARTQYCASLVATHASAPYAQSVCVAGRWLRLVFAWCQQGWRHSALSAAGR